MTHSSPLFRTTHRLLDTTIARRYEPPRLTSSEATRDVPVVLHVRVVRGSGGGPDKTVLRTAQYAEPNRYDIHAAYICPNDDPGFQRIRDDAARFNCPLWEINESGAVDPRTLRSLLKLCRRLNVRIWHGHDYKSNLFGLLLRRVHRMTLVTTTHGWTHDTLRTRLYYHIDNRCLPRYDHVMTVSPQLTSHCRSLGVASRKLTYLPNGIESQHFTRHRGSEDAKHYFDIDAATRVIGCVGRLSQEKGVDRAIHTIARMRTLGVDVQLHLIGDGPQAEALAQLAQDLGVSESVIFHGWQADTRRLYEAMDVLLLPSHTEGMPNVVLEAMAMDVPVAATRVGAVPELLDEGRCGVILDRDDTSQWPLALTALLRHDERTQAMVAAARLRVESRYDFAQRVASELAIYDHLLGRTAPLPRDMADVAERTTVRRAA